MAPKKKWNYLQKYWHQGAFFQEAPDDKGGRGGGEEIYGRDYSAPTGEDKMDKSVLPSAMQVGRVEMCFLDVVIGTVST